MRKNKNSSLPRVFILLILTLPLIFVNCSGKESLGIDTTPPEEVILIPHLGDTGDDILINDVPLNDSNNGLDAVPDNYGIRIQWRPVDDLKLDYIKIFRYGDYSPLSAVDSLSRSEVDRMEYLDSGLHHLNPAGQTWYYYVKGYSQHGFYSVSDTVSYGLLQKTTLMSPPANSQICLTDDDLTFQWWRTDDAIQFRLLIFDENNDYIWHHDYYIDEETEDVMTADYMGPDLTGYDTIIWRVDTMDNFVDEISMSGAESFERHLYLCP